MILTVFFNWNHSVLFLYLIFALYIGMKVSLLEASDLLLSATSCPVVLWNLLILWPMGRRDVSPGSPAQGSPNTALLDGVRSPSPAAAEQHTEPLWIHSVSNSQKQKKATILYWEDSSCQSYWERDKVFVSPSGNTYLKWPAWCLWNWGQNYTEFTENQCVIATAISFYF